MVAEDKELEDKFRTLLGTKADLTEEVDMKRLEYSFSRWRTLSS